MAACGPPYPARGHMQIPCGGCRVVTLARTARGPPAMLGQGAPTQRNPPQVTMGCKAGASSREVSYLFLNVNGAGVRHGGCMAGETRRHMVKVGTKAAQRTCTQPSKQGDRQGLGGLATCEQVCNEDREPLAGTVQGDRHAWCPPGVLCQGEPRGGHACGAGGAGSPHTTSAAAGSQFRQHPPARAG